MKYIPVFFCLCLMLFRTGGASAQQRADTTQTLKIENASADSTEYSIVVTDPGYDSFMATQPPMDFYSEAYYKHWNTLYVTEWNIRYETQPGLFENRIDYDPHIHYGIRLEYQLYGYFRFFEKKYHVILVDRGR